MFLKRVIKMWWNL